MNKPRPTLYERLGGQSALAVLVDEFYDRVLADPELAPFFAHTSIEKLRRMQSEFLASMLDGPVQYTGVALSHAHAGRGITLHHYRLFANHFLETLKDRGVAPEDIALVLDRLNLYADDIRSKTSATG
jgi:hemoglobin